jgi:hypothetical protein
MKKLLLLSFLFIGCNNSVTNESTSNEMVNWTYDTLEEAVMNSMFDYVGIFGEEIYFIENNKKEIKESLRIIETESMHDTYYWTFVDFFVGTDKYREVITSKKMYDGRFSNGYLSCYTLDCSDELDDKIDNWKEDSPSHKLSPYEFD